MKLNLCTPWRKRSRSPDLSQKRVSIKVFNYEELQKATKDFSEELGSGCFGSVHRGMLPDSTLVAVKKLVKSRHDVVFKGSQMIKELVKSRHDVVFKGSHIIVILNFRQHINVLPVIGICCDEAGGERILVYDYMPRRSLDLHLFQQQPNEEEDQEYHSQVDLDWNRRYQIALGAARGLYYLHRHRRGKYYVHGSIKPENIILDSEFCPKLTDYYLSSFWRQFDEYHEILTTSTRTTTSYIAPEILSEEGDLNYTKKSDVYSYGMVLFEMISGIRNSENGETPKSFPTRVTSLIREGGDDILSVLDSRLFRNADEEEVLRVCKVACWCIHDDPQRRPSMEQVIGVLEGVIDDSIVTVPSISMIS